MKKLLELTENFETSKPVFQLTKTQDGDNIDVRLHPAAKYTPTPTPDDVLSELVCGHFNENFNMHMGKFVLHRDSIAQSAMEEIRNSMAKFLEKNLEMKNPRQSKVYRWFYRNLPHNSDFNDTLVMVYKYMRSFCDDNMRANNIEHTNNAIALLDAIMEKDDEQD